MDNLLESTENNDLNKALKIIKTLINHNKKEVMASSLGNIFVLIHDKSIRKVIINELNELKCDDNISVRESAEESLDVISSDLNKYEILDYSYDILNEIISKFDVDIQLKRYLPLPSFPISKINSAIKSKIINSRFTITWDNLMYNMLKVMLIIDKDLDIFHMTKVDVNNYYEEDLDIPFNMPYNELSQIEVEDDFHLDNIITVYATTFRENGSIYHLESLLNDDNENIRHKAVNGLLYALKGLTNYKPDKPHENLINQELMNLNHTFYGHNIKASQASK
jgi:hypothetical protein